MEASYCNFGGFGKWGICNGIKERQDVMCEIKNMIRECFRYKISGVAMVSCFVVSMLAMHYGISIYNNILTERLEKNNYQYSYELNMSGEVQSFQDIPKLPSSAKCNMKIRWFMVHDDMQDLTRMVNISVSSYEEKWPLISGSYATEKMLETKEKIILIGQAMVPYAYGKDGDMYYDIAGEAYRVIGVFGSEKSGIFDEHILMYVDCLGSRLRESILDSAEALNMTLESDTTDAEEVYYQYIAGKYSIAQSADMEDSDDYFSTAAPSYNEKEYCIIIYVFSLVCMWFVIRFWLTQRTHEIKVCRAFGFSNTRIVLRLLQSLLLIFLFSMVIFSVIVFTLQVIMRDFMAEYRLFFSIKYIAIYIFMFFVSMVVIGGKSVYRFVNESIVKTF